MYIYIACIYTIWRPNECTIETIKEGVSLKLSNITSTQGYVSSINEM